MQVTSHAGLPIGPVGEIACHNDSTFRKVGSHDCNGDPQPMGFSLSPCCSFQGVELGVYFDAHPFGVVADGYRTCELDWCPMVEAQSVS